MKCYRLAFQAPVSALLLLLLLSATARAAGSPGSSTTITPYATTNSLRSELQAVVSQTSETNSIPNTESQGDSVVVVDEDQAVQSLISNALVNGTIAGEVEFNRTGPFASVVYKGFSVLPSVGANDRLDVMVSGENVTGPRAFIISLSKAMDPNSHTLLVTLDGQRVSQLSSLALVLHPTPGVASYSVMKSSLGYQLLVSVPHFSTHMLTILPLPFGPLQGFFPISGLTLGATVIAFTAIFAAIFASRKRISVH